MVVCEVDKEVSGEILGWKLSVWQALFLHRVLPSCGGLIIYLIVMCYDLALVYEQFQNKDNELAIFCLILMALPALISLMFTLASPPPGLQTEESAFTVTIKENDLLWIFKEIFSAVFFPITAIGRYCYLIFWWIEAVCSSYSQDEDRTREALTRARDSSSMELYLFLQAFIHCAPHAVINIVDMMAGYANPAFDKITLQAISLVASSLRMASTATMYRRFEREKLCGRRYPWGKKVENQEENVTQENTEKVNNNDEKKESYEPIIKRQSFTSQKTNDNQERNLTSDLIEFSPRSSDVQEPFYDDYLDSESDQSLESLPPITRSDNYDSDDEYVRPVSIIDRVAPRRRDTQYTIETVEVPPPPAAPAPRPGSLAVWAEKLVENAESIPTWLSAPPRRKHWEVIEDEPDIPRRVPRSYLRGLLPQDATASLVNFLGWYTFFVSRLISIAAFIDFFPFLAIFILLCHYQVMLLFLIIPQASTVKRAFYVFLAFIYLFCLMEFKIRFRHVRVWHVFWIIVCTVEIVIFISLWASVDNKLHNWWKGYIVTVTIGSMLLSYILFLVYFLILQPRETVVYLNRVVKK